MAQFQILLFSFADILYCAFLRSSLDLHFASHLVYIIYTFHHTHTFVLRSITLFGLHNVSSPVHVAFKCRKCERERIFAYAHVSLGRNEMKHGSASRDTIVMQLNDKVIRATACRRNPREAEASAYSYAVNAPCNVIQLKRDTRLNVRFRKNPKVISINHPSRWNFRVQRDRRNVATQKFTKNELEHDKRSVNFSSSFSSLDRCLHVAVSDIYSGRSGGTQIVSARGR